MIWKEFLAAMDGRWNKRGWMALSIQPLIYVGMVPLPHFLKDISNPTNRSSVRAFQFNRSFTP